MDSNSLKALVAQAALQYVKPDTILGVGTGSTVDLFIDALGQSGIRLKGAVSSSVRSEKKLREIGVPIMELNDIGLNDAKSLSVYIDGADEIAPDFALIKGGGGALTREKIVAEASELFVCIADGSKLVDVMGKFPLPVEVLPMARELVAAKLKELGGQPKLREGFITDNGNEILDVHGLSITNSVGLESQINQWPGVVTNGLFAIRRADICLIGTPDGVKTLS